VRLGPISRGSLYRRAPDELETLAGVFGVTPLAYAVYDSLCRTPCCTCGIQLIPLYTLYTPPYPDLCIGAVNIAENLQTFLTKHEQGA
jgi:hypothetical protein